MGLIGDKKSKKNKDLDKKAHLGAANGTTAFLKKGGLPPLRAGGGPMQPGRYPAGYYTTPAPLNSHRGGPGGKGGAQPPPPQAGVNPRYQTWVAPRKQPHLSQLVSTSNVDWE